MRRAAGLLSLLFVGVGAFSSPEAHARTPSFEQAVVLRINQVRKARGLRPLRTARPLRYAAARHTVFLARKGKLVHHSADGSSFARRIRRTMRHSVAGEVVAVGATPRGIVAAWLASPGHRRLLLEPRFRLVGVGARPGRFAGVPAMYVTADLVRP
jgi:uncharacterized protein YkwD